MFIGDSLMVTLEMKMQINIL